MALQLPYSAAPDSQVAIPSADLPSYAKAGVVTLNGKTVHAKAYWQVSSVSVAKTCGTAHLIVYSDSSKNSAVENKFIEFNYDINGENPIKQAYKHLKALPEFANAVDC